MTLFERKFGKGFICTDPNNYQYRRKISDTEFEFVEVKRFKNMIMPKSLEEALKEFYWYKGFINLDDYEENEINNYISFYYSNIEAIKKIYNKDTNAIIAECIFEKETQY